MMRHFELNTHIANQGFAGGHTCAAPGSCASQVRRGVKDVVVRRYRGRCLRTDRKAEALVKEAGDHVNQSKAQHDNIAKVHP